MVHLKGGGGPPHLGGGWGTANGFFLCMSEVLRYTRRDRRRAGPISGLGAATALFLHTTWVREVDPAASPRVLRPTF